jgi:cytochrome P450
MIAGYETTATTLSFCSYELALNPECQEKLFEEINSAIDSNEEISYETLAKLPYLDSVISETLRLYPPIIKLEREAMTDYKLGDTGITLFKGQVVEIPVYPIHHSEEYYPNPENFNPSRFMPENRDQIIPYTYLPFGAGPRNCIGMKFALMEAKLCLAHIVRRYKFIRSAKTEVPLEFRRVSLLLSTNGLIVGIQKR